MRKRELTDLDCELIHETDKAWLLDFGDKQEWIPKSIGDLDDKQTNITLPVKYAQYKELI